MESKSKADLESQLLLSRLLERLKAGAPAYEWDDTHAPLHSSYDNWHCYGWKRNHSLRTRRSSKDSTSVDDSRANSKSRESTSTTASVATTPLEEDGFAVVARVSRHTVRLEREFRLAERLKSEEDKDCKHFVEPVQFLRLPPRQHGDVSLVAAVVKAPGPNYIRELVELGPNWYKTTLPTSPMSGTPVKPLAHFDQIPAHVFLDFAIGAAACCEILHHGNGNTYCHGEIRPDAFHFNKDTRQVKLINFGSGVRSFENGLTSAGWSSLTSERGVEHRLQFIAPEQTGRMPAEPDTRTDIYSLGIVFWTMLTGEPAYRGDTPLEIMHSLLSKRVPAVDIYRPDIPHIISSVIHKMTKKSLDDRYQSSAGLKYDLMEIKRLLGEGDANALENFKLGAKDVSCFFNLPNWTIGRTEHRQCIAEIIEKASARAAQAAPVSQRGLYSLSSHSSTAPSGERVEAVMDEALSVSSRSGSGSRDRLMSQPEVPVFEAIKTMHERQSQETVVSVAVSGEGGMLEPRASHESKASTTSFDGNHRSSSNSQMPAGSSDGSLLKTAQRLKKRGRTETVSISGSAGLGKSSLLQTAQTAARRHGYYAQAKFDQVKKAPFEPVLRVMSSLFRQIFSENDVSTEFHNNIRSYIKPYWPILCGYLDLPPWLLSTFPLGQNSQSAHSQSNAPATRQKCGADGNTASDWLRAGASSSNSSSRFKQTFLEVLRLLALQKFFVLVFDDLQFADDESLDLLLNITQVNIPIVLILTFRDEEALPPSIRPILDSATRIELQPFSEAETTEYVSQTLHRPKDVVATLAAVVQQATRGNPFFIREMLDVCHRKHCIYYSWRMSQWEFDLDKVFSEFSSPDASHFSSNDFLLRRLQDLSPATRCVLAWASLIGNTFSFTLVKHVVSCECSTAVPRELLPPGSNDPVSGLQGALNAYILVATDDEDRFRFSHDRYLQSAEMLCDSYSKDDMHFVISIAMMKHDPYDRSTKATKLLFDQARHICNAAEVIKIRRPGLTSPFRDLLYQAAETAREQGARSISLFFYQHCLLLLPDDPWDEESGDVKYQETLTLLTKAAAAYWYLAYYEEAETILKEIFEHARLPSDKTPAFIIQSRMCSQRGDNETAFSYMERALEDLGIEMEEQPSWEACDTQFRSIIPQLKVADADLFSCREADLDTNLVTIGAVMTELLSAAYWSNALLFYSMSLKMVQVYLKKGLFPQVGLGFVHLASIALSRFDSVELGVGLGDTALKIFDCFDTDAYTIGRGLTLHSLFVGTFKNSVREELPNLERAMEATMISGDRALHLLNLGVIAAYRQWASDDLQDVAAFINYQSEAFPKWPEDLRGGAILTSVHQFTRCLQGKTDWRNATHIFDDNNHQAETYISFLNDAASTADRPVFVYTCYRIAALYRYGYWEEALRLGEQTNGIIDDVFSVRFAYHAYFYIAMSLFAKLRDDGSSFDREAAIARAHHYEDKLRKASAYNDINFAIWLLLLRAETAELEGRKQDAVATYEKAIDHAVIHTMYADEAMCYELYGEFLIRRGASRPARGLIQDAMAAYQRISASGKAVHISEKHGFLLHGTRSLVTADASTQTMENDNMSFSLAQNEATMGLETSTDRTRAWLSPTPAPGTTQVTVPTENMNGGLAAVGLDMIDLASILESSQLLSSELRVDKLLNNMTKIIVDSTSASLCGITVNENDVGWCVAAAGGSDSSFDHNVGQPVDRIDDSVLKQVTLYTLRFKEEVFLQNVLEDERFGNVPSEWRSKHPEGRAMIALPILHGNKHSLLGSLFIQGPPNYFTQRNLTVLRLLVSQISISIANAMLFKKIEKVSASNASMLEMQKQALAQARAAEHKAKVAEANAMEMVRLKEEAAKAKSMFLANVSHELRTPLNGVIGMSELLKGTTLNAEQESFAASIRVCADTLLSVINDILDFSKLEAGKMQMFNVQLSLTETISEVVRALSYTNIERGLKTVEQLELDPGLIVMGDPVRLHQILMNLLSNAYKFTAKGTVTIKAVVDEEDEDSIKVTCSVTDTGIGISEEQRKKLFQPFSQADSSTARSYGGTGLGLSICKAIIENVLQGTISLSSTPGVGTTVAFSLRFQKVKKGAPPAEVAGSADPMAMFAAGAATNPAAISLATVPRDKLKICIAEDNPINQKIAINFVKKLGFRCEAYGDGQQAVDALAQASKDGDPFHLVLMDVQMPVLDGYHATREIRKHPDPLVRDVMVIAMTASAIRGDREKCLEAGMNNYMAKPVRAHVLKQMLEGYLGQTSKPIPDLQIEANRLAEEVLNGASIDGSASTTTTTRLATNMRKPVNGVVASN